MKSISQYILGVLFLVLMVELIVISPSDVTEDRQVVGRQSTTEGKNEVLQVLQDIHAVETKNDKKEWEMWAQTAKTLKEKGNMALDMVRASFFSSGGVSFEVVGAEGLIEAETKNMVVDGGVTTTSSNGYVFKAQTLKYNSKEKMLTSPTPVQVVGPRDKGGEPLFISGLEMAADLQQGVVIIDHDVKARKTVGDNKKMAVLADQVKLSSRAKTVRFSGNVIINMSGLRIAGSSALFTYNDRTQQLDSIDLEGGVRVSDFSKWATSEKLSINIAKNEYVFNGQPRVVQDQDELRGDKIIFEDGGKRVKVQNAKIKVSKDSLNIDKLKDKNNE